MRATLSIIAFLALSSIAIAAPKYMTVGTETFPTAANNVVVDAAPAVFSNADIGGISSATALEWFRQPDVANQGYVNWKTSTIATAAAPGSLPGPSDDVVLGWRPTGTQPTTALFIDYGNPKLLCATGGCFDVNVPQSARNTTINSLTLTYQPAAGVTYPIIFTGYPYFTGTYDITTQLAFTVTGSLFLRVLNGIELKTTNTAIYGTNYGVNLGGQSAGIVNNAAGAKLGQQSADAASFGGQDATSILIGAIPGAGVFTGRNAMWRTPTLAAANPTSDPGHVRAQLNKYGFILATPKIYINPCGLGCTAASGTEYGASSIQGPNLFIQPHDNSTYTAGTFPLATPSSTSTLRVNITISPKAVLFTTAVNYINADFYIRSGGVLAFCEPIRTTTAAAAAATLFGYTFQDMPIAANALSRSSSTGGSYQSRTNIVSGTNGLQGSNACHPMAGLAYDWFGTYFTSVRIFNANPSTVTAILYSEASPNLAKLVAFLGQEYTVPVLGNITILMQGSLMKEYIPVAFPTIVTTAATSVGDNMQTGRVLVLGGNTAATAFPTVVPNTDSWQSVSRGQSFLGAAFPINPFYSTISGSFQSIQCQTAACGTFGGFAQLTAEEAPTSPQALPFVTSWDCSRAFYPTFDNSAAVNQFGTSSDNLGPAANSGAACGGNPIPTRFTFFGGIVRLTKNIVPVGSEPQFLALSQRDVLIAGDGTQRSVVTVDQFTNEVQITGFFAARQNGAWIFNGVTVLSSFTNLTNAYIRSTGQSLTAWGPADAAGTLLTAATAITTPLGVASSVCPTAHACLLGASAPYSQMLTPVIPLEQSSGSALTAGCVVITSVGDSTLGTGCTAGDYSYLYTLPAPLNAATAKRTAVIQVFCSGGFCGANAAAPSSPNTAAVAATDLVSNLPGTPGNMATGVDIGLRVFDEGCYTAAADAAYTVRTVTPPGSTGVGFLGYCTTPPTIVIPAASVKQLGGGDTATVLTGLLTFDLIPRLISNVSGDTQLSLQGLLAYPSMARSNVTVGQFIFNAGGRVQQQNLTVAATTAVVPAGATLSVQRFQVTANALAESSLKLGHLGVLAVQGGTLTSTASGSASNIQILPGGKLSVSGTGTLNGVNVQSTGSPFQPATFIFPAGGVTTISSVNVFTGNGTITYAGSTTVSGTVTSVLASSVASGGSLVITGGYSQQSSNLTVADNSILGTTGIAALALSNTAMLIFGAGASGINTPLTGLTVTMASSSSNVIFLSGSTFTARGTLLLTGTSGSTAVQVAIFGKVSIEAPNSIINSNVLVSGTTGGAGLFTSSIVNSATLSRTTAVQSGNLGNANSRFQIGTGSSVGSVAISGSSSIGGVFDLANAASFISNAGTTSLSGATQITTSLVAPSTTSVTTDGSTMALFNTGTLTLGAAFSSAVDIVNSGTISVSAGQALTIAAGRNLRLRAGTVSGAGTLTINGNVFTDTGANNLVPSSIVNNGVITVGGTSTLVLTTCITGSGTLVAAANQVTFTSTGSSCFNLNTATTIQSLNSGLAGTSTPVGSGLLIITGTLSGQGAIVTQGTGLISLNNNNALTLTVTASSTVGTAVASSTDAITVSGTICVNAGVTFSLGASTVGTRATSTPFALTTSGVTATFSCAGALNLLGALTVQSGAGLTLGGGITVTGTGSVSVASGASMTISGAVTFNAPSLTIVGSLVGTNTAVLTLGTGTTLTLSNSAQLRDITIAGTGNVVVNGAVVVPSSVTISTSVQVTGSITASNGATLTFSGLVVCINSAQVLGSTTNPQGKVIINGNAIGCTINQNVQLGANGQLQGVITFGGQIITLGTSTIFANANVTFTTPTYLNCPTGTVCVVDFGPTTRLIILFNFACLNTATGALVDGQINCPNPGTLATAGNVRVIIRGVLVLGAFTAGARMAGNVAVQDQFTFPIATFGQLILTDPSVTVINAQNNVLTGSSQLNPTIIINDFTMAGTLIVNTQNFVPLHPTILFRSLNGPVSGRFANIIVNSDTSRSLHPWAWNIGTPTVRYVGRDVVLDPTGNGVNAAAGVAPSFLIALFAVVAAFFMRN